MGLAVGSDATNATYKSYTQYYDANGTKLEQNVVDAIQKYQDAQKSYKTASAQNTNLTSAYGYATAYTEMMDALENSGLSDDDQKKLKTLLGMSATQRVNSVMDAAGNVYTEAGKDADGNTIYAYDNNGTKQYIQKVVTYQEAIILHIKRMMTEPIQIKMVMSGQQPVIRMMMEMQNILIPQMMARPRQSV